MGVWAWRGHFKKGVGFNIESGAKVRLWKDVCVGEVPLKGPIFGNV